MGVGLYIHIPYCRTKCQYCSFNSWACAGDAPVDYLEALLQQIGAAGQGWAVERQFSSIFIGGGTPTIYKGQAIADLLDACFSNFSFSERSEVSIECNPNTASAESLQRCLEAGVNRLSIGVQALNDRLLKKLGRTHSAAAAQETVRIARIAGFANINLDLMYGLPGQSLGDWRQSLRAAVELAPEHLALYELSIEDGTPFAARLTAGELDLPDEEEVEAMEEFTISTLADAGFGRYEISNYAKDGFRCQHNINYWRNGDYLGLGAGAVACLSGLRLRNVEDPTEYIKLVQTGLHPYLEGEALSTGASFRESVIMGLRMLEGVDMADLKERYGLEPETYYGRELAALIDKGLVEINGRYLRLSKTALPVANQVLSELV